MNIHEKSHKYGVNLPIQFFLKIETNCSDISLGEFKEIYPRLHDIIQKLMRSKYRITLPPRIFKVIKMLHEARNNIIHDSRDAKSDFILELCSTTINAYFTFILGKF